MINKRIKTLREKFDQYNIDGYVIPKNDEFFSEYANKDRLKNISDFTGSAGLAIVMRKKNYLFIDGRYTIQAEQQAGNNFKIIEIHKLLPKTILKNLKLGFDPNLFTQKNLDINFDLPSWLNESDEPLEKFNKKTTYQLEYNLKNIHYLRNEMKSIYANDKERAFNRYLMHHGMEKGSGLLERKFLKI